MPRSVTAAPRYSGFNGCAPSPRPDWRPHSPTQGVRCRDRKREFRGPWRPWSDSRLPLTSGSRRQEPSHCSLPASRFGSQYEPAPGTSSSSERGRGAGMAVSSRRIRWAGSRSEAVETRPEAALRRSTHQANRGITAEAVNGSSVLRGRRDRGENLPRADLTNVETPIPRPSQSAVDGDACCTGRPCRLKDCQRRGRRRGRSPERDPGLYDWLTLGEGCVGCLLAASLAGIE
jgi:hypothetical protein